jgi:hypothetical protein
MRISQHSVLSNPHHGAHLPTSWRTLAELCSLPNDVIEQGIADGRIHPAMERRDVRALTFDKSVLAGEAVNLKILQAILGEPYPVLPHQTFRLCGRHYLFIEEIVDPPQRWAAWLTERRFVFIPWPDILAADLWHYTAPAALLVQPNRVIAGELINYYLARHGPEALEALSDVESPTAMSMAG